MPHGMTDVTLIDGANDAAIAFWLQQRLAEALAAQTGEVAITLPGGSTPFPILALLAKAPLDWHRLAVWPGDDRIVEEASPYSNVGRIRAALEPLGARIVPLAEGLVPPHFTVAWLGMGTDGHIASLFPNTDPRVDDPLPLRRLIPDPLPPEAPYHRLSLTIPALTNCDAMLFVARGDEKRALIEDALRGAHDLPVARLLAAARAPVTCFT